MPFSHTGPSLCRHQVLSCPSSAASRNSSYSGFVTVSTVTFTNRRCWDPVSQAIKSCSFAVFIQQTEYFQSSPVKFSVTNQLFTTRYSLLTTVGWGHDRRIRF